MRTTFACVFIVKSKNVFFPISDGQSKNVNIEFRGVDVLITMMQNSSVGL